MVGLTPRVSVCGAVDCGNSNLPLPLADVFDRATGNGVRVYGMRHAHLSYNRVGVRRLKKPLNAEQLATVRARPSACLRA